MKTLGPGSRCKINAFGDLYMIYETRSFIDQECEIIKIAKSGLVVVRLLSDPRKIDSFPKRNVDIAA